MRDVYQLLREKELQIMRVRHEIESLRASIPLLADEGEELEPESASYSALRVVNQD
jgi:hypothetical protein